MDIPFDPVIPFLGIYCREKKEINDVHEGIHSEVFTEILFAIVKNRKKYRLFKCH